MMDDDTKQTAAGWHPISDFPGDTPFEFLPEHKPEFETKYYARVLVYGVKWKGGLTSSYPGDKGGKWGKEPVIEIGSTYSGIDFFTISSSGPSDYDEYLKATHWMPLPEPPQ